MTHTELVKRAVKWLRNTRRCAVVESETSATYVCEQPDAIGWKADGKSIVVECKTSLADFYSDRRKPFRLDPACGLGMERWYLALPGVLPQSPEALRHWGLLEIRKTRVRKVVFPGIFTRAVDREIAFLVTLNRRLDERWNSGRRCPDSAMHIRREEIQDLGDDQFLCTCGRRFSGLEAP